jgi:hypothetical protein
MAIIPPIVPVSYLINTNIVSNETTGGLGEDTPE